MKVGPKPFQSPRLPSSADRHCDGMKDFDFCRDPALLPSTTSANASARWLCTKCGGEYDRAGIEFALMRMVFEYERRFAQQDLKCQRCGQVRADNVSRHCGCSGAFQLTMNRADVRRKLRTMVNVALAHNMGRLKVCAIHDAGRVFRYADESFYAIHRSVLRHC